MNPIITFFESVRKSSVKYLLTILLILGLCSNALAQAPTYFNYNSGSPSNSFPFATAAGKQLQSLVAPGEWPGAYFGNITNFYVQCTASQTATFTTFVIKMGQTTATTLPSGVLFTTPLTTVFSAATYTGSTAANGWIKFVLQTPFLYDPTKSLVIDISQCSSTNTSMLVINNSLTGFRRTYVNAASCVFTYSGQDANIFNCGIDQGSAAFNDAGVMSIDSPASFCGGPQNIKCTIKNYGRNQINPVTVNWSLGGVLQTPLTYTTLLDTMGKPNNTVQLQLGTYTFPSTPTVVKAWTSNPNNVTDTVRTNDTATVTRTPAISGAYTINPSGSGSSNFLTFTAAVAALNIGGVCGPVYFTVAPGTYTEKVTLTNIIGTSAVNTITFDGVDSTTRILTFAETTTASNIGTFNLIGTSWVTVKNMVIRNTGTSYGAGVSIQSGSNNNTITNCRITVSGTSSTYCYPAGICGSTISTTSTGANNTIKNSTLVGGYTGAALYGSSSTSFTLGNKVIGNNIWGNYLYGIYSYYQQLNQLTDNRIFLATATNTYGIYAYYNQDDKIDRNIVVAAYMGMYIYNNNNVGTTRMSCSNNIINMNGPYNYSTNYGLYALYNVNGDFLHNSVYTAPSIASGYASYLGYGSGCNFQNNIFQSNNAGMYAVYCPSVTFNTFDYNILFAPGASFVYWGAAYANLQALQAATSAFHQKSFFKVANFLSLVNKAEDLHLNNSVAATYGNPAFTTPTDVDGDPRCQFSPTIGADESKFGSGAPTANFTAPDTIFVNSPITLLNNNLPGSPLGHKWYVDGVFKGSTWDLPYKFTATGTFVVKIVTQGCFGTDSITKTLTVYAATQKPIANFISDLNVVETYQNTTFKDLSIKGPTYWYWTFTPSIGVNYNNGTSNNSPNPQVNFANPGLYQVCLWDSNAMGRSSTVCKTAYILVRSTSQLCIFPFDTKVPSGTMYDDGGPNGNYSANQTCNFLIDPCASSVTINFTQFDITSNSFLRIYDGKDQYGTPLFTGSGFTGTTLPGGINGITAYSGKMYIEFQKGTAGTGFAATWTSVGGSFTAPSGKLDLADTLYDCGALTDVSFVPDNSLYDVNASYYRWYFDYANNSAFPDWEGKGYVTVPWSYGSTGIYIVRCEIEGCGGNLVITDTVIVDHPTRGPLMNFNADITTATTTDVVTLTDLSKYDPVYRRWKITGPGIPTTKKGNSTSKVWGVTFPTNGLYTVQILDSNCIAKDSLIKTNYILVVNYCTPAVSILNKDFALLRTKFGRSDTVVNGAIQGFSYTNTVPDIGTVAYRDNTAKLTSYLIGGAYITKPVEAIVGLGGNYGFSITRNTSYNNANFKIWIDYNQDGTFQNSELAASSGPIAGQTYTGTVSVPLTAKIGNTRMRVATAYDNLSNTPCGANTYGEFNDFRIRITPDATKPIITFTGNDVLTVEVGRTFTDPGFSVTDDVTNPCPYTVSGITTGTQITSYPSSTSYTVTATDGAGNVATRTRTVNAGPDVTKPVISMIGSSPINVEVKSSYVDSGATAADFFFGNFTPYIVVNSNVNVNKLGVYQVTYDVTDSSGNKANQVVRTVIVRDTQKPVITLNQPDTIYLDVFATFVAPTVTVTDNYYSGLGYTVSGGPVKTDVIGTYVLSYDAVDSSGNAAVTKKFTVIVKDNKAPSITLLVSDIIVIDVNTITNVPEPGFTLSDNYYPSSKLTVNVNYSNVKLNVLGDYIVRYYVTDPSGNIDSSKARTYRIVDRFAPVITLNGLGYIMWQRWKPYTDAGSVVTDNYYTGLTSTVDVSKVNIYVPGVYQVTYNVTDPSGNIAKQVIRTVEITADANGINNADKNDAFSVYPNPSNGQLNVNLNIASSKEANIMIFDANGKAVYSANHLNSMNNTVLIDLSNQASGMYFIKVVSDNYTSSKSFSIQK